MTLIRPRKLQFARNGLATVDYRTSSLHKFVLMVGAGGNGKSVLLDILSSTGWGQICQ